MQLRALDDDVYACLQPDRGLGWSNSGFVARGGGMVVDTFWDLPRTRAMLDLYAAVPPKAPQRVVNTHHNGDHCWVGVVNRKAQASPASGWRLVGRLRSRSEIRNRAW